MGIKRIAQAGWSLLELAIVIVIIGLITGGVLVGQQLIGAAEVRAVMAEIKLYRQAIYDFEGLNGGLPGDIHDASARWPDCDATPSNCNGNTDGRISWQTEGFRAWQQLAAAGMVKGQYTGTATGNEAEIGINVPASQLRGAGYTYLYFDPTSAYSEARAGNYLLLGSQVAGSLTSGGALSPADAMSLEQKMDDGFPDSGEVLAVDGNGAAGCVTGADPDVLYAPGGEGPLCALYVLVEGLE